MYLYCCPLSSRQSCHRVNDINGVCLKFSRDTIVYFIKMPADFDTFRSILYYCVAILALPISTFFTSKFFLFDRVLGPDSVSGNVYSAICAVIMLHAALGVFIYKAYCSDEQKKPEKID